MNFMSKTRCKFNGDVTNNIRQNVKISSNNYESMSNNGNSSSENLISIQSAQTTSNTNNNDNNNNNKQIHFNNSSVEFNGHVLNGCQIEKVIIINNNDNTNNNECNTIETGNNGYKSW
eukprot:517216_1